MDSQGTTFCAYCYEESTNLGERKEMLACGSCNKRHFCSRDCQRKDWISCHQQWCCNAGEMGHDYEVRESPGKGMGLFALRSFVRNETVLVERPLFMFQTPGAQIVMGEVEKTIARLSDAGLVAFELLDPVEGSYLEKLRSNAFHCPEDGTSTSAVFTTISRINHECVANCSDSAYGMSQAGKGLRRIVASRTIEAGEELTISYFRLASPGLDAPATTAERRADLINRHNFWCQCHACTNAETGHKLERAVQSYQVDMLRAGQRKSWSAVKKAGTECLQMQRELHLDSGFFAYVCKDMFGYAVTQRKTLLEAPLYAQMVIEHARAYYGADCEMVQEYTRYLERPEMHMLYLMQDRAEANRNVRRGVQRFRLKADPIT